MSVGLQGAWVPSNLPWDRCLYDGEGLGRPVKPSWGGTINQANFSDRKTRLI